MPEQFSFDDIKSKEKNVKDIANFIINKPNSMQQALYCMLIGAGASVSSGIKTGQDLVREWRVQILKQSDPNIEYEQLSEHELKDALSDRFKDYDVENEYCSLFKKIYDLPSQRRNFIERQVEKADSPSIGYQYLNLLARDKYLETFFTTNFDDLLELSLSPINSADRPIVCAQDSSISNISITSHRTKIIKLHGDFLYNDLSSTPEETEKLKNNMGAKFEEFLKNYGLIVLGYAGNDSSVMDVLNRLLDSKQEYLNNGIYWCIRRTDYEKCNISAKLKNLLKKDKVYYIIIDGFDEFCAELTHEIYTLNNNKNVLFTKSYERQHQEIEKYYSEQQEKFANNFIICNDIKNSMTSFSSPPEYYAKSEQIGSNADKDDLDKYFNIDREDYTNYSDNAITKDIKKLIKQKEYTKALEQIDQAFNDIKLPSFLYNYYSLMKAECYMMLKERDKALKTVEDTIKYNNKNQQDSNIVLYMQKSVLEKSIDNKINALKQALEIDRYDYNIWNRLAYETERLYFLNNRCSKDEVLQYYEKSISLNNNPDNDAYIDRISFAKRSDEIDKNTFMQICENTIDLLEKKDPYSVYCFNTKIEKEIANIEVNPSKREEIYSFVDNMLYEYLKQNKLYERNAFYVDMYFRFYSKNNNTQKIKEMFHEYDNKYGSTLRYCIRKAKIYLSNYKNLKEAISVLESIDKSLIKYSSSEKDKYYKTYLEFLLFDKQYEKVYSFYNKNVTSNMKRSKQLESEILFHINKDKFLEYILDEFSNSEKGTEDYVDYTYNLLKIEDYDEVYKVYQSILNDENVDKENHILKINYNMSKKFGSKQSKITKVNLENIFNAEKDSIEKAAAYILIDDMQNAEKIIQNEINKDYEQYYYLQRMPVFQNIDFEKFKSGELSLT